MNMNIQEFLDRYESGREGEKLQHVLIGSMEGIDEAKRTLHSLRYATIGLWSPVIPMPGTHLYLSVDALSSQVLIRETIAPLIRGAIVSLLLLSTL